MASAAPSMKRSDMRVLKAFTRKPIMMKLMTRKIRVPRLIVEFECGRNQCRRLLCQGNLTPSIVCLALSCIRMF